MTFSFNARLYSMMTGQLLSSSPRVSMRPPCAFPVTYSVARNRTPRNDSRCCSINDWSDFSMSIDSARSSLAESDRSWNSLISAKAFVYLSQGPVPLRQPGPQLRVTLLLDLSSLLLIFCRPIVCTRSIMKLAFRGQSHPGFRGSGADLSPDQRPLAGETRRSRRDSPHLSGRHRAGTAKSLTAQYRTDRARPRSVDRRTIPLGLTVSSER